MQRASFYHDGVAKQVRALHDRAFRVFHETPNTTPNQTMTRTLTKLWHDQDGSLSFEWAMVLTLLVIGIVSGLAAARDAIIDELGDIAQAAGAIDQSFELAEITAGNPPVILAPSMSFTDDAMIYTDCARAAAPAGQGSQADSDS
jgi:hypothetical protein